MQTSGVISLSMRLYRKTWTHYISSAVRIGCLGWLSHPNPEFGHPKMSKILCVGVRIDTQLFFRHISSMRCFIIIVFERFHLLIYFSC